MLRGLARTFIIFGLYGFIPGFWLYGLPVLLVYGAIKLTLAIWRNGLVPILDRVAQGMLHGVEQKE